MADKQATIYTVDLGGSMARRCQGRSDSNLDFALRYVWDKIASTADAVRVANGRKTDTIGVVGFRTDETRNELADRDESYVNISVLSPIKQFLTQDIREMLEVLKPNKTIQGDGISAVVIAVQMIIAYCRKLKYKKNIFVVTDGMGLFDTDGLDAIVSQVKEQNIQLTILGVDFDDPEFGFKEEDKDPQKAANEGVLRSFCEDCEGAFGTLAEAVQELEKPRLKTVRPQASYKGRLTLGNPNEDDANFSINIERYPRTMIARPPTASKYVETSQGDVGEASWNSERTMELRDQGSTLQNVRQARTYNVKDEHEPGGKVEVDREDMDKGYKYGRTIVPISKTDEAITVLQTVSAMEIVGFISADMYKRFYHMSTTNVIVGQKGNESDQMALSSLIHALFELDAYALVRFVKKQNDGPVMMVLAPEIDAEFECLVDVQVPFVEDVRPYKFPPLGRVKTASGKVLEKHRNISTPDMDKYMSAYVDSMDIGELGAGEDGPSEYAPVDDTFSLVLHRINQVVRHRAVHPLDPIPPTYDILLKYSKPPQDLVDNARDRLKKLIKVCDVKRVEPTAKGKRGREAPKPKSGLDIDELLSSGKRQKTLTISRNNAIPDFKRKLEEAEDSDNPDGIKNAVSEMMGLARELIKESLAGSNYDRAVEYIRTVREACLDWDYPDIYNDAIEDLKREIVLGRLDGDRKDMFGKIRQYQLGLFTTDEGATATPQQAQEFYNNLWV